MPEWKDIPLIMPPNESVEEVQNDQYASTIVDAVPILVNGRLHLVKRPGLRTLTDLGTGAGVDGLYWFEQGNAVIAVSNGHIWKITDAIGTKTQLTGADPFLLASNPVTFASDATRVIMANGGVMAYTDLSATSQMADGDAPTAVTHVAVMDGYILANNTGSGRVQFSNFNDMTAWEALDFFTAESKYDDTLAIAEGFREIIAIGSESVEFWVNDGINPFSRIPGSAQPFGISAKYSLALIGGTWIWLDNLRRFVTMQGRQVVPVSTPFDRTIQRYTAVDDAVGYATTIDGMPIYVCNFPNARETLAYNWQTQQWHKWGEWYATDGIYRRFRGLSYCYARAWNKHLIGDHSNGIIYEASREVFTDNSNPIRSLLRTGHITHGASFTKQSHLVRLNCKRGVATSACPDPQLSMRRRVDNGRWHNERFKSLGQVGQHRQYIDWRRNGNYKSCQYEFVHSDNSDLVVMGAQEYLTPLGR